MKKFLVLAALALTAFAATDAAAVGGRMRTVGLQWGTWTPQGFVASADTSTILGATQRQDTTGVFDASLVDWAPMVRNDPNAQMAAFKGYVFGTFTSVDTVTVTAQGSIDGVVWFPAKAATAYGVPTTHGNQNVIAFHYGHFNTVGEMLSSSNSAMPWKYFRFIVKADGNTAALLAAAKVSITHYVADDQVVGAARIRWESIPFGTWAAGRFVAEKDTSSFAGDARDTTGLISWADFQPGPGLPAHVGATSTDSATCVAAVVVQQASNASSNDSLYVGFQASPDGYTWAGGSPILALTPNAGYYAMAVAANVNNTGTAGAGFTFNIGTIPSTTTSIIFPTSPFAMPFSRFELKAGSGGEVAGGAKIYIGRWVAAGSELGN